MKLLNNTQIEQVAGGNFISGALQAAHDGAKAGWNKPVTSTLMPYPFNYAETIARFNNARQGAWTAFFKFVDDFREAMKAK